MNITEIRAKFPQYNDMSDDDLLIGIHKKFYSDVPIQSFLKSVQYTPPDPSEGSMPLRPFGVDIGVNMPEGAGRFLAGAGKAFTDVARGAGQMIGAVDRQDVARSRQEDAALMNTGAGLAGNITGNIAALAPTAFIPGAATIPGAAMIGAGTSLLQPSTSTKETLGNMAIGGIAAPAAIMAGRGVAAAYQGAKGLAEPLTRAGQERIAARVLQATATDPAQAAANAQGARAIVPGSNPTLAQIANDPGLAQLERTMLNNPEYAGQLQQRFAQQRGARLDTVRDVAGMNGGYYDAIKQGRDIFAKQDYAQAMAQGVDTNMAQAMAPQIESLMRRPSIQEAQKVAQRIAAEKDIALNDFGSLQGLDWLKKALDKQINGIKTGNPIGNTDLETLVTTKSDLMKTLEQIAPGYAQANSNYAAMSRQVNGMDVAQSLYDKLQKPGSEYMGNSAKEMGRSYAEALSKAQDSVKKATGMNKTIADVMPTRDIAALENVARDYGRKTFAEEAGRSGGSPTLQNMLSQNMLRRFLGPTGLPESWAESTMLQSLLSPVQLAGKVTGAQQKVMDRLAMSLLDPKDAAGLLMLPPEVSRGLLSAPLQQMLPGVSSGLLAVQLPQ